MTRSQRRAARTACFVLTGLVLAAAGAAWASSHEGHEAHAGHAAAAAGTQGEPPIEMLSANVQGKNVYIPSTVVMLEGRARTLSVFNATDTPHGFSIAEANIAVVLPPGEETRIEVPALEEGLYRIFCQLHPPHRSAQLLVVEDD